MGQCRYVSWTELDAAMLKKGMDRELFSKLFGCQTACDKGPYPYDVEAVLERMMSGKLTGTQLHWD